MLYRPTTQTSVRQSAMQLGVNVGYFKAP